MQLIETINFAGAEFVEEAGQRIVKNVVMLGPVSKHGYEYEQPAMAQAVKEGLYEGVRIFINHNHKGEGRDLMHLAGVFREARHEGGKVRGNAHLLPDEYGSKFWDIAKTMPEAAGCSHVADGRLVTKNGKRVVEAITKVYSVDLVFQGATTKSVFEAQDDALVVRPGESQVTFSTRAFREIRQQQRGLSDTAIWKQVIEAWDAHDEVPAAEQTPQSQTVPQTTPAETPEREERTPAMSTLNEKLEAYDRLKAEIVDLASGSRDRQQIVIDHQRQLDEEDRQRQRQQRRDDAQKLQEIMARCDDMLAHGGRESDEEFAQRLRERRELREQRQRDAARIAEQALAGDGDLKENR